MTHAIIATKTYPSIPLRLKLMEGTKFVDQPVRVSKSATLDGASVIFHSGFATADKTISLSVEMSDREYDALIDMLTYDTAFSLSCHLGFFNGAISNIASRQGKLGYVITFLVGDDTHTVPVDDSAGGGSETGDELIKDFVSGHFYRETSHSTFSYPEVEAKWGYSTSNGLYRTAISFGATELPDVITTAVLRVTAGYVATKDNPTYMDISADCSASPALPSSWYDFDVVPTKTDNRAFWKISAEDWTDGTDYDSVDISNVLNELKNHANYDPENPLILYTDTFSRRSVTSVFNTNISGVIRLVINEA